MTDRSVRRQILDALDAAGLTGEQRIIELIGVAAAEIREQTLGHADVFADPYSPLVCALDNAQETIKRAMHDAARAAALQAQRDMDGMN